jgi:hypothetical protein
MNLRIYLTSGLAVLGAITVPGAYAESYTETTTIEKAPAPVTEVREEVRTEEMPSTTIIKEEPITVIKEEPVQKEKVVVKKHGGHLIQAGPIKIF